MPATLRKFSQSRVKTAIAACRSHLGEEEFFHGNCGMFAIALAKWIAETTGAKTSLVGVVLNYPGDERPRQLAVPMGQDIEHVFALVELGDKQLLFDGTGLVKDAELTEWQRQAWYDIGPGDDSEEWMEEHEELPDGVALAFGDLDPAAIEAIENGTEPGCDWTDFYEFLNSL